MLTPDQINQYKTGMGIGANTSMPSATAPATHDWVDSLSGVTKPASNMASDILQTGKAAVGGIASGVGGAVLTAEDYLGRKAVNAFGTPEMKSNLASAPSLNEQFKTVMGGQEHPLAYGAGQLAGEVGSLVAPVGAAGNIAKAGAESLGAGKLASNVAKAATEGAAFTAGQGLQEGKQQSLSDYAINSGISSVFPLAGAGINTVAKYMPSRVINSLIKPLLKDFAYEKNPGQSVAELGITGNNFDDLIANIKSAKEKIGQSIGTTISQAKTPASMDLIQSLKPIDDAIAKASKTPRTNASLIDRLNAVKADLTDNAGGNTVQDAHNFKGMIGDLTKWTGNASDDAAVNKALKQTYGSVKGAMEDSLSKSLTPEQFAEYKKATEHYGNLMSAENAAVYRDKINERQNMISFGAKNAGLLAGLGTAIATGGIGAPAVLAGLAGAGIDKALATPAFKTRLATLLAKLPQEDVGTFFEKVPGAKSLFTEKQAKDLAGKKWGDIPLGMSIKDVSKKGEGAIPEKLAENADSILSDTQKGTLAAVHNTTERKLDYANRIGGFANPSVGIFNPSKQGFESFGDITLVAPKSLLISSKAKTFASDVYSPRFPRTTTNVNYTKLADVGAKRGIDFKSYGDLEDFYQSAENDISTMASFLKEKGVKNIDDVSSEGRSVIRDLVGKSAGAYRDFIRKVGQEAGVQERIFKGFSPSGTRKYAPLNAETASKEMNTADVRGGENLHYGLGSIRSQVVPQLKDISSIKKAENRLVTGEEFEKVKTQYENEFSGLVDAMDKYYKYPGTEFSRQSDIGEEIGRIMSGKASVGESFTNVPADVQSKLNSFKKTLAAMPTEYFETKFKRPVDIGEFSHAVVPKDTSPETIKTLEDRGIHVVQYEKGKESQTEALKRIASQYGLLFGAMPFMFAGSNKK